MLDDMMPVFYPPNLILLMPFPPLTSWKWLRWKMGGTGL